MEPFATAADLEVRWRTLNAPETARANVLLGSASRLIRSRVPDVDSRITAETLDPELLTDIACDIVKRAMISATPVESESASLGGQTVQRKYSNPMGNLYLTKDEISRLCPPATGRAFSISLIPAAGYSVVDARV